MPIQSDDQITGATVTTHIALVVVQILFGINYAVSKMIVQALPPLVWASARLCVASVIMLVISFGLRRSHRLRFSRDIFLYLVVFSLMGIIINQASFLVGLRYTTSTNSAIINSLIPILTLIIVIVRGQERIRLVNGVGFALALSGVLILQRVETFSLAHTHVFGDFLTLINCMSYALFLSYAKKFLETHDRVWTTTWMFVFGSIGMGVLAAPDWAQATPPQFTAPLIAGMIYSVICGTIITYFLNMWALARTASSSVALYIYLQPIVAAILALVVFNEPVSKRSLVAMLLIFSGMLVETRFWSSLFSGKLFQRFSRTKMSVVLCIAASASLALEPTRATAAPEGSAPAAGAGAAGASRPSALTLAQAIEKSQSQNPDVIEGRLALRSAELVYNNAWDTMYMPSVSLFLNSSADRTLFHAADKTADSSLREYGYPSSAFGVSLAQYTLYNFGKDQIVYDQARLTWERQRQLFEELKRTVKFNVIIAFWTLKSAQDQLDAYERSVEIAQAILDLQKSRAPLKKATDTDLSSSEVDLINVKNLRDSARSSVDEAQLSLNILIGDPLGTSYAIDETIDFLPIKVTEAMLIETYLRESPNMKTARSSLQIQQLSLAKAQKDHLPLPKIQFSGVTLSQTDTYFNRVPGQSGVSTTSNGNFDVSAVISYSIPLTGPGGLFDRRSLEQAAISVEQSEVRLQRTLVSDRSQIILYMQSIRKLEDTVGNNTQALKSSIAVLQSVLDRVLAHGIVNRLDLRDALAQARDSEISLSQALVQHLNTKTRLASFIGVDYLPRIK